VSDGGGPADTLLLITRHGQTDANREQRVQGQGDTPLNAEGLEQARRLAAFLADEFPGPPSAARSARRRVDRILSSDLLRARQTAEILRAELAVPVTFHPELRARRMGEYENRTHAELSAADPESFRRLKHDPAFVPPGGGESTDQLRARALPFVRGAAALYPGQCVVILSHHKVCQLLIAELAGSGRMAPVPNARPAVVIHQNGVFRLQEEGVFHHGAA